MLATTLGVLAIIVAIGIFLLQRRNATRARVPTRVLVDRNWFQGEVKPLLEVQGYDVALPPRDKESEYLRDGWEHIKQPDHATGQLQIMVIGGRWRSQNSLPSVGKSESSRWGVHSRA